MNKENEKKKGSFPFGFRFVLETDVPEYVSYRNSNPNEIQTDCPFCSEGKGKGKLYINTYKNTYYCQHCKEHGGMLQFHKEIKHFATTKDAMKDLMQILEKTPEEKRNAIRQEVVLDTSKKTDSHVADIFTRDVCYRRLIENSDLSVEDRNDLSNRGLSEEQIKKLGIVSTPALLKTIAERTIADCDGQTYELSYQIKKMQKEGSSIPGIYPTDDGVMFVKLKAGIMIPVLDKHGLISMFQVRYHNPKPLRENATQKEIESYKKMKQSFHKYAQLSSGYMEGGCSTSGIEKVHHVGFNFETGELPEEVCLTEGCLKADVASYLEGNRAYIAVLGVNNTNQLFDEFSWLYEGGTSVIRVRFDMDFVSNDAVRQAIYEANAIAQKNGAVSIISKPTNPSKEWIKEFEIYKQLMNGKINSSKTFKPLPYKLVQSREELKQFNRVVLTDLWNGAKGKGIDDYLKNGG